MRSRESERKKANIYKIAFIKPVAINGLLPTERKTIKFCSSFDPIFHYGSEESRKDLIVLNSFHSSLASSPTNTVGAFIVH